MTPEQFAARVGALAGRDVRVRPDLSAPPHRWVANVRGARLSAAAIAAELDEPSVSAVGDELVAVLDHEQVGAGIDRAAEVRGLDVASLRDDLPLTLTRNGGRSTTYAELVGEVGRAAARWAVLRSSDGRQIDCASEDLAGLTLRNPAFPVLLAATSLARGVPCGPDAGPVAARVLEWPLVVADAARTGRTRPLALHLEVLADAVCTWSAHPHPRCAAEGDQCTGAPEESSGATFVAWTGERLARASRIVLVAGLSAAGIDAPARI